MPSFDSTPISPSITSTIRFAIESPRPKPSCSSEPDPGRSARTPGPPPPAAIPVPVSATSIKTSPSPPRRARSVTTPGGGVFLNAFVSRPISTWRRSTGSPCASTLRLDLELDLDPVGRRHRLGGLLDRDPDVERLRSSPPDSLHPGQGQQRVREAGDPLDVLGEAGQEVVARVRVVLGAGAQDLDRARDAGDRVAQLVGGVGDELALGELAAKPAVRSRTTASTASSAGSWRIPIAYTRSPTRRPSCSAAPRSAARRSQGTSAVDRLAVGADQRLGGAIREPHLRRQGRRPSPRRRARRRSPTAGRAPTTAPRRSLAARPASSRAPSRAR